MTPPAKPVASGDSAAGVRAQVALLTVSALFVGAMVGLERTTVPLLAGSRFGLASTLAAASFVSTFGLTKAVTNLVVGGLAERWSRRQILLGGWLLGMGVPLLLVFARSWAWVLVANGLLGVQQGLCWSVIVNIKVDIVPRRHRGLVVGLNQSAGFTGMALTAWVTGVIAARYGLEPRLFGVGIFVALAGLGLGFRVPETPPVGGAGPPRRLREALARATGSDAVLTAASLGGHVTNVKDGALWVILPLLLAGRGVGVGRIGVVTAIYPAVWGLAQLGTGPLSDRVGRRPVALAGLVLQTLGVVGFALGGNYALWLVEAACAGLGTALVYPALVAQVADHVEPAARDAALGVYRMWRDAGYVVGALGAGAVADAAGLPSALGVVGGSLAAASILFFRMTRPSPPAARTWAHQRTSKSGH